jgi:flagellar assembly factor FliW
MKIKTKPYGEVEIAENKIIYFEEGLIGFENVKKYVLLDTEDKDSPFKWLQAVERPDLAFVIIPPTLFKFDYKLEVRKDDLERIGLSDPSKAVVFAIVVIPHDNPENMTANLLGPVVINPEKMIGKQMISTNPECKVRHYVLEEMKASAEALKKASQQQDTTKAVEKTAER